MTSEQSAPSAVSTSIVPTMTNTSHNQPVTNFRIPGTFAPEWLDDSCTRCCMLCEEKFTLLKRRHHCRSCGKIYCSQCCSLKAKLLYLNNEEARICLHCSQLSELMLPRTNHQTTGNESSIDPNISQPTLNNQRNDSAIPISCQIDEITSSRSAPSNEAGNPVTSTSCYNLHSGPTQNRGSTSDTSNKRVSFPDGIRPGTDLTDQGSMNTACALARRQTTTQVSNTDSSVSKKFRISRNINKSSTSSKYETITVFDEIGFLPPVLKPHPSKSNKNRSTQKLLYKHLHTNNQRLFGFDEIVNILSDDGTLTFVMLNDLKLKVKMISIAIKSSGSNSHLETSQLLGQDGYEQCWCFLSEGLRRLGQRELFFILAKESDEKCIPRDVFQIYLMTHELALRGQSLHDMGSLVFEMGLFDNKLPSGVLFLDPKHISHLKEIITAPPNSYLLCLLLHRSEIPWAKVFPMRLYYKFGYQNGTYPCAFINHRKRNPLYYEIGHSIICILADFRNYLYSVVHIPEMNVCYNRKKGKVSVLFPKSAYKQITKVLDKSSNEHVLAWSCEFMPNADGHLVALQNEDGDYECREFMKDGEVRSTDTTQLVGEGSTTEDSSEDIVIGASFVIFSGALKANSSGQKAKISIVEDGLLIQVQSCTMSALKNSIHYMDIFNIDCGDTDDTLKQVLIDWIGNDNDEFLS